jgi:hypothetical protein
MIQGTKMQNGIFGRIQLITMITLTVGFLEMRGFIIKMAIIDKYLKFLCEVFHSVVRYEKRLLERVFDRNQYGIIL